MKQQPGGEMWKQKFYSQTPEGGCRLLQSPEGLWAFTGKGRIVHLAKHLIRTAEGWRQVPNSNL